MKEKTRDEKARELLVELELTSFKDYMRKDELLNEREFESYIFEGIDVDIVQKSVSFNDTHEELVDTSLNNPTVKTIKGIKTIMLFKRKKSLNKELSDGNPLVYALKGIKGWSISKEDRKVIMDRVQKIIEKIDIFDTIIVMPSSNPLVEEVGAMVHKIKGTKILDKCVFKREKEEILEEMPWQNFTEKEKQKIWKAFDRMKGENFESKYFPKDQSIIDRFEMNLFKSGDEFFYNEIHNKNILIIDDTISTGFSLANCSKVIKESYFPKSITQLSLFSDL